MLGFGRVFVGGLGFDMMFRIALLVWLVCFRWDVFGCCSVGWVFVGLVCGLWLGFMVWGML